MSDREKDVEILVLRHQLLVLQRRVGKPTFTDTDRAILAGLLHHLPKDRLRHLLLLVRPDTVLRWHRDLLRRRHAATCLPRRRGRPRTIRRSDRSAPWSCAWPGRMPRGGLAGSTANSQPCGSRSPPPPSGKSSANTASHPHPNGRAPPGPTSSAARPKLYSSAIYFEVRTLTGARLYVFAVIEHATRRIRILGATTHPTADWIVQLGRNLLMDLEGAGNKAKFLIRDRDSQFTAAFDTLMADASVKVVTTGIRIPRMNSLMERWIQTCRTELLDRTLIWNQSHLMHTLREYETFYNEHRPHRALEQAAPCRPLPAPITQQAQLTHLEVSRRDRLGGVLHQYQHAA